MLYTCCRVPQPQLTLHVLVLFHDATQFTQQVCVFSQAVAQSEAHVGAHQPVASVQVRDCDQREHTDQAVTLAGVPQD